MNGGTLGCYCFVLFFYQNIYPKICACARVDLDGVNFLTFAIVFPVPGGSAEHNLFSQPVVIWFFGNLEDEKCMERRMKRERRRRQNRNVCRPLVVRCGITTGCALSLISAFKLECEHLFSGF